MLARLPDPRLRRFVSHYWLSRDNSAPTFSVLPDGCVDLVLALHGSDWQALLYGTTTAPMSVPLAPGHDYLGICFHPGQARHFVTVPAGALTNTALPAAALTRFPLPPLAEQIAHSGNAVFRMLDDALLCQLARDCPSLSRLDGVLFQLSQPWEKNVHSALAGGPPQQQVARLSADAGLSARQLQRLFREAVGVSPKTLHSIQRVRWTAAQLVADTAHCISLAALAFSAGYSDQSHMTRDCVRLLGATPAALRQPDVAFVQAADAR
ncbi:MAG: helix-turn-helix domain-containing protein [Alcanivorax sp.]|nr:helix-turn-helix domain-containing protein [Alcanivorax sp.]